MASTSQSRGGVKESDMVNLFRNYELRTAFAPPEKRRLPTTLVTGWLGSGKTTVMRHVLANRQDLKVACAVNDFAELNIDAELVSREDNGATGGSSSSASSSGVVALTNGCLCCTLGGELETEVWRMLDTAQHREEQGMGQVEYLLIETSGLVDPTETVAALDRKFGKLARVRLDSVVCVVDAESAAAAAAADGAEAVAGAVAGTGAGAGAVAGAGAGGAGGGGTLGGGGAEEAWARQLSAADVVLLNKVDLLVGDGDGSARLAAARDFVTKWAPEAKVVECVRGQVPLPAILDVELMPQPEGKFGHDWDSAARPFLLSPTGGGLRKETTSEEAPRAGAGPFVIDPTKRTSHRNARAAAAVAAAGKDDFGSVSFEGGALSLAAFQRWVAFGIPEGVVRAKGFVTFAEEPRTPYDFHLSGRRRIEIELSSDNGGGGGGGVSGVVGVPTAARRKTAFNTAPPPPASTRLVLIGPGLKPATSLAALRALEAENNDNDDDDDDDDDEGAAAAAHKSDRPTVQLAEQVARARQLIADDTRLEFIEADEEWCASPAAMFGCVHFRLTGAASNEHHVYYT